MSSANKQYEIHIYVKKYYHHANSLNKYTQLVVDGIPLNTAKAEKLLGPSGKRALTLV